jgi:hypothetical protein
MSIRELQEISISKHVSVTITIEIDSSLIIYSLLKVRFSSFRHVTLADIGYPFGFPAPIDI